jgi:catechol 2,3-dioxygenase-like lactoylglutathione lyase family enzyme
MALTRLEHYLVMTDSLEATRDFYRDVLGMRDGERPSLGFPGYWLYLGAVPCIHIAEWHTCRAHSAMRGISVTTPAPGTGALDHIAFNAEDLPGIQARLDAHAVAYTVNAVPAAGLTQLFLKDPNGIKLEINVR